MAAPARDSLAECEVRVSARPETVFSFFTDPERMMRWTGVSVHLDPQPGGVYDVDLGGGNHHAGRYVELTPFSRLVFTFGWEGSEAIPPGSTTVEVTFEPDGSDTVVRLRHAGLATVEDAAQHTAGWDHYLARLAIAAAGGDPGPDTMPGPG